MESITVVTPCFNAEGLVRRTAESILAQGAVRSGRLRLQYLVCDGGSTDRTVEVVQDACGERAEVLSAPDRGMYDALAKGLGRARGDMVAYLNAGDLLAPSAFDVVADVVEQTGAEWLTGLNVIYNRKGQVIQVEVPYRYRRRLIRCGMYAHRLLPFIQQESTFWSRRLLEFIDLDKLSSCKLAGDHYLWTRFAQAADLTVVHSHLGGFSQEPGQKSEALDSYRREQRELSERAGPMDLLLALADAVLWRVPGLRYRLSGSGVVRWSPSENRWR